MKYLIVVDVQNDFIRGSLPADGGEDIIHPLLKYIKNFNGNVIFTQDTHDRTYPLTLEWQKLPIEHCRKNTWGWEIVDELKPFVTKYNVIEKSTFASKKLASVMWAVNAEEIQICGVCTSICVASNALMIRGYCPNTPIKVLSNLCADVSQEKHEAGLSVMDSCQIDVMCGGLD